MLEADLAQAQDAAERFLARKQAGAVSHSNGDLLSHLRGVRDLLTEWGAEPAVALAGMFHSVYGTEMFRSPVAGAADREEVRGEIGERAERLAHTYGLMTRDSFMQAAAHGGRIRSRENEAELEVGNDDLTALCWIWAANWLEQRGRTHPSRRGKTDASLAVLRPRLPPAAVRAAQEASAVATTPRTPKTRPDAPRTLDGLVPPEMREQLANLSRRNIWRYGWRAANSQTGHSFWHCHFGGGDENSLADCTAELQGRPLVLPIYNLWCLIEQEVAPGHTPVRVYANGHTYGGDGHVHRDSTEHEQYYTTIYYAHPEWHPNWGGETLFFDPAGKDVVAAVHPLPGRITHFRGDIPHAARSPARDCPHLRVVYVFKSKPPELAAVT